MNTAEEKVYLYEMMKNITEERRELTKIYYELKSRLDHLIMLETRGLENTAIKGVVDLHNQRDLNRMKTNIEREAVHAIRKIEEEIENKTVSLEENMVTEEKIEEEKEKDAKKNKRGRGLSVDKAAGVIAHVLKEQGTPIKTKDLFELVNAQLEVPIAKKNFSNNVLPRSAKINKRINNVSRGFWQYLNS